ncbi:hypothetical protein QUF64_02720 [Anaerolineales bacterium HSG6]|nr:hypothetical protein [Anaerolineales bacterium HSG6]
MYRQSKFYLLLMVTALLVSHLSALSSMNSIYAQDDDDDEDNYIYLPLVLKDYPSTSSETTVTATATETATPTVTATATGDSATATPDATTDFTLTSIAVSDGELLDTYKCEEKVDGVEKSIPLAWSNVPSSTGSLAVIMHHYPHADDTSQVNSYLLLWAIDPSVTEIPHGEADDGDWFMGANKDGAGVSYSSPCSPSAGVHEYTITLYALSERPSSLPTQSTIDVDYYTLIEAIGTVNIEGTAVLTFNDVNE